MTSLNSFSVLAKCIPALALLVAGSASANSISVSNTGVGSYILSSSTDPNYSTPHSTQVATHPHWADPIAGTSWINPTGNGGQYFGVYTYTYTTTFDLTGLNYLTAQLSGSLQDDDKVEIILNGHSVSGEIGTYSGKVTPFSISNDFVSGLNNLSFVVTNYGGPTGLDVAISGTAKAGSPSNTPEPASMSLAGLSVLGGTALTLWNRRFRKQVKTV